MNAIILDDDPEASDEFVASLKMSAKEAGILVEARRGDVAKLVEPLLARQETFRAGGKPREIIEIDQADLVVVDYDLRRNDQRLGLTGEEFSYLARCFSDCGAIVALNQFPSSVFDLTLVGRGDTWADVNIDDEQLKNSRLWTWEGAGYRPWNWPCLAELPTRVRWMADKTLRALRQNVNMAEFLRIPKEAEEELLPAHLDRLGPLRDPVAKFAVRQLASKDQPNGNKSIDQRVLARAAAARLRTIIEHQFAPGQDLLCDRPHLAQRFPSLVKGRTKLAGWQDQIMKAESSIRGLRLAEFALNRGLPRNYWWLPAVRKVKTLLENKEPWKYKPAEFAFLEDSSTFEAPAKARKFSPGSFGSMRVAYVSRVGQKGISYLPATRLLE